MFQNWGELKDVVVGKAKEFAADIKTASGGYPLKGKGKGRGIRKSAAPDIVDNTPFADAWKVHCSMNQRLRDPRKLGVLVRRGVPEELRAEVWSHCLGLDTPSEPSNSPNHSRGQTPTNDLEVPAVRNPNDDQVADSADGAKSTSEELPFRISELIDADVTRTFPTIEQFHASGGVDRLRGLLRTLALADAELGYCQSLNFIAAIFMMVFQNDEAVLSAVPKTLTKLGIRKWYLDGMQQLRADTIVLEDLIRDWLPQIHEALTFHKFDLIFVSSKWFLCLFTTVLEGEAIKRVWDVLLCDGIEAVFRISLSLLARREHLIVNAKSHDDLIFMFQDGQSDASPESIVRTAYDPNFVGPLSRSKLAEQRQQALTRVSSTDTRSEMRRQYLWRGGVRPASVLAR